MYKKVLLTRIFPELASEMLRDAGFTITMWEHDWPMSFEELVLAAQQHNAVLCALTDKIDATFLAACPNLEMISQFAVGYDNIDIAEATRRKIPVGFTPDVLTHATADVAFGLMVATSRKMFSYHKSIIEGKWDYFRPNAGLGIELRNKTLGIFGMGRIGFELAKRCIGAFDMNVIYHNRKPNHKVEEELGASYVSFEELLKKSDVLSVHCSLSESTKGLFDREVFKKMKAGSIFINTSRGLVHNEEDLIEALRNGEIWGAGLDVTNPEPMLPNNPLLHMENVSVLPHIGSGTVETRNEMARIAATNIIDFYKQGRFLNVVNSEVFESLFDK
jgi:glyoxylate reductase